MASNDPHWETISSHLDQVLDIGDAAGRAAWLENLRARDSALADELRVLLDQHRALVAARFLEDAPAAYADLLASAAIAGQTVGAYTIVAPIGSGGMGTVWLAERSDGRFDRRAAVKFLNVAVTGAARERFTREGRILARLSHPHIAQLLDAGVTANGQPYLVLEYVEGEHIADYCARQSIGLPGRIGLFLDVLAAVAHAHGHLIVHRDLKPSNILVTRDGTVKLLDFGIAKLLDDEGTGASTELTRVVGAMMTPAYASPEQKRGGAQTTATDIYSLGALLSELLKDAPAARPPRDLECIVEKAMRDEAAERYASVDALAEDLRAFLESRPVRARSGNAWYHLRRFTQRYRMPIAAVALALIGLSAGLIVVNRERAISERRFQQVRQLANNFIDLDDLAKEVPGATRIRNRIVSDSLRYLSALAGEARGDPRLTLEIARGYMQVARVQGVPVSANLGQFTEADASLARAESLTSSILARDPANRDALLTAASVAHDRMSVADTLGRKADAQLHAEHAVSYVQALTRATPSVEEVKLATYVYSNVAVESENQRRFGEAVRYCRRALEISEHVPGVVDRRGPVYGVLAWALWQRGEMTEALTAARTSRTIIEPFVGATFSSNLVNALWREGKILGDPEEASLGRNDEAMVAFRRALGIAEGQAQKDRQDYLSRHNVAKVAMELGAIVRDADARKALAIFDQGLSRIREAKTSPRTQRDEAALLARSSFALRALHRDADARHAIDGALRVLRDLKQYPADTVTPMSEADMTLRALAAHQAATGEPRALDTYQELFVKVQAAAADPENDLRDATWTLRTWAVMIALLERLGRTGEAAALGAQRAALAHAWSERLAGDQALVARIGRPWQ